VNIYLFICYFLTIFFSTSDPSSVSNVPSGDIDIDIVADCSISTLNKFVDSDNVKETNAEELDFVPTVNFDDFLENI
jgi:hypothetical protein